LQKAGTTFSGTIGISASGTSEETRVIVGSYDPATGNPTTVKATVNGAGQTRTITCSQSWVTIQDLELVGGTSGANRRCIGGTGNSIRIQRLLCRDVPSDGSTDCNAIFVTGDDCEVYECVVREIADDGIWIQGARPRVIGNHVSRVALSRRDAGDCLQLSGSSEGFYVVNNVLDHSDVAVKACATLGSGAGGGLFGFNTLIGPPRTIDGFNCLLVIVTNARVVGNRIVNGRNGITTQNNAYIQGNIIDGANNGIVMDTGGSDSTNVKVFNNTILNTGDYAVFRNGAVTGVEVRNNLIVNCAKGTGVPSGVTRTNNNYFNISSGQISDCIGGGCVAETYTTVDPQLRGDYVPQAAAVRTGGTFLGGKDYYGKEFQPSAMPIGAVQPQPARTLTTRTVVERRRVV
jgi:hypothetical protein